MKRRDMPAAYAERFASMVHRMKSVKGERNG
jgi:hypothetical protein